MEVGFVGLGNIGAGAAKNLVLAGHRVTAFDLDASRLAAVEAEGAVAAGRIAEVAANAEVVFTSLPGPAQISAVGLAPDGLIANMIAGATWIELSTNDLETVRTLERASAIEGVAFLDAPVSGGPEGAEAGTLSIFVGGDADILAAVSPLLDAIGSKVDHVGPSGAGVAAKIAQVTLCYTQTVTLVEAMLLGVKAGVEPSMMLDLIKNSAGTSYVANTYGPEILAGTYDASFPIGHAAKDMRLAADLARSVEADLPFMSAVAELYAETESIYGAPAPHLLAAQIRERANHTVLHELITNTASENASPIEGGIR